MYSNSIRTAAARAFRAAAGRTKGRCGRFMLSQRPFKLYSKNDCGYEGALPSGSFRTRRFCKGWPAARSDNRIAADLPGRNFIKKENLRALRQSACAKVLKSDKDKIYLTGLERAGCCRQAGALTPPSDDPSASLLRAEKRPPLTGCSLPQAGCAANRALLQAQALFAFSSRKTFRLIKFQNSTTTVAMTLALSPEIA